MPMPDDPHKVVLVALLLLALLMVVTFPWWLSR
jgi:hypothetical protein